MGALTGKQKLAWAAITLVVLLWSLFPVYSILMTSFKTQDGLFSGTLLPPEWTWENYEAILAGDAQEIFLPARRNSVELMEMPMELRSAGGKISWASPARIAS